MEISLCFLIVKKAVYFNNICGNKMYTVKLKKLLNQWKKESGATGVIQFSYWEGVLKIYTSEPMYLCGEKGILINKFIELFKEELYDFTTLKIIETDSYWI
jgi:hypothetical protein